RSIACGLSLSLHFFFQAEDGIRDRNVTGVQTCALPILRRWPAVHPARPMRTAIATSKSGTSSSCSLIAQKTARSRRCRRPAWIRSEERRVGKEGRAGGGGGQ